MINELFDVLSSFVFELSRMNQQTPWEGEMAVKPFQCHVFMIVSYLCMKDVEAERNLWQILANL